MTYEEVLAKAPKSYQNGDTKAAATFVQVLTLVIEGEGIAQLNRSQQGYLYKLRSRWQARAAGTDVRWNVVGTRPGRPPRTNGQPRHMRPDPSEETPLFKSLMRKYGTPHTEGD